MPIAIPTCRLTPAQASAIAKRARKLLRKGLLTHCQYVLLDALLWSCRRPDTGAIVVSYSALQRLTHQARATIANGLRRLVGLGLLTRIKRRVRFLWGGGMASRQAANGYVLHPPAGDTEFTARTDYRGQEKILVTHVATVPSATAEAARKALAAIAERRAGLVAAGRTYQGRQPAYLGR